MNIKRRKFLVQALGFAAGGLAVKFGMPLRIAKSLFSAQPLASAPVAVGAPSVAAVGTYGAGVRAQIFEVIVKHGTASAPWREICGGPAGIMQKYSISDDEVAQEIRRRCQKLNLPYVEAPPYGRCDLRLIS